MRVPVCTLTASAEAMAQAGRFENVENLPYNLIMYLYTSLLSAGQLDVTLYDRPLSLGYNGRSSGEHSAPSPSAPIYP